MVLTLPRSTILNSILFVDEHFDLRHNAFQKQIFERFLLLKGQLVLGIATDNLHEVLPLENLSVELLNQGTTRQIPQIEQIVAKRVVDGIDTDCQIVPKQKICRMVQF